jgi:TP901 family phage tail tape measure protein
LSTEYEKHTSEVENAKVKINELSVSIEQLNSKIQKQIGIEQTKGTGSDGGELLAEIEGSSHAFNKAANKSLEDAATKNEKSTKIDPSTVKVANQAAGGWSKAFKALSLYTVAMRGLKTACQSAVKTVSELDKYLTEQAMVTGKSRKETYGLLKSYQDLAAQCGATTKEIAEVSTEYLKQGKSIQEAMTLTEAAVKAAKVARVSVGDSVNYLTTALNGFQLSANDAMLVSDKFAAVAAASATDYDELAIALSKVASQANLAGMSIDYTTALLTKGLETTREAPETMGTALKTIIARMRELGDYGETLDDGMDINNVESQLKYVGIALRDSNGELRSTEDVLDELGHKWDGLNKNQQAAIAKALAGTRQQARLIAMMEDYERVTELQQIAQRSQGATAAQADTYLEGMEAAINNVKVAWEKVTMAFTDSEVIIKIVDKVADAITVVGDVLDTAAGQVGVFGTIAGISAVVLGNKMKEHYYAKEQQRLDKEDALLKVQQAKEEQANLIEQEKAKVRIRHEEKIASIEQAGLDKINALENRSAQLEELKLIAKQKIEGHKQAIQEKENLIIQIEENRMEQENLLLDIERNKEFFKRLAAEAEAAGNMEAARQWADQYNASAAAYTKEQQQYEAADYSGQISKQEHSISGHKGAITKVEKEIAGYDKEQQTIPGQIQQVVSDTKKEMGREEEALQKDLQSEQFQEQISGAQQAIELLTKQEELLKAQLSPINAITSGITGWISPLKSFANGIQSTIKGVGNLIGKLKNIGSTSKKNEKQLKKETKELKNSKKALKDTSKESKKAADAKKQETQASRDNVKVEKQEVGVNYQEAASEGVAAAGTKLSSEADEKEAQQNITTTGTDVAETVGNTGEAVTEGAAAATSGLAAAADAKEARDSIKAAKADAVESMGNVTEAITGSAESASKIPYVGWIIALGLLAAAGVAVGVSMANVNGAFDNEYGAEKKAENINKLSGEIYELTERARALDDITDSFQDIDDKVIKTKKDIEEMNSLLEQAGDELSDEIEEDEDIGYGKGVSAKEAYAALSREEDKVAFLEAEAERNRKLANEKRQEQLDTFNNARDKEKSFLLYGKDAQYVNARSAIYGINNNTLYERIDALKDLPNADKEALESTEALVQSMLNELDITRALEIANEDSDQTIKSLINTLSGLRDGAVIENFMNEDASFKDRVQAFRELTNELQGNQEMLTALKEAYSE